jgi:hypothetical protein
MAPPLHAPERFEAVLEARAATASRAIDAIVDLVPPHDYGPAAVGRALRYSAVQRGDVGAIVAEHRVELRVSARRRRGGTYYFWNGTKRHKTVHH